MDCIILAGNRENYRGVSDESNKAFLRIDGRSIIQLMMIQLAEVDDIDRLIFVGPKMALEQEITAFFPSGYNKPVLIHEQRDNLVENVRYVFDTTNETDDPDRYVLILPSDIPLLTAAEVSQFIHRADMNRYDYVGGLTTNDALARFYPTDDKPGIRMAYFYCRQKGYRVNNMHMIRPHRVGNIDYIRQTYGIRYLKKVKNLAKLGLALIKLMIKVPTAVFYFLGMLTVRLCYTNGHTKLGRFLEKPFTLETAEVYISKILETRFKIAYTDYGGAAIDVDNERDYITIQARYQEWMRIQEEEVAKALKS